MVIGRGQMAYWKGCNVPVYEKDSEGKERIRKLEGVPNGEGRLQSGTELYIMQGKLKQA